MMPVQGRRRQRGPLLRQGPVRLRLRHPPGPPAARRWCATRSTTSGARSRGTRRSPRSPSGFKAIQAEHGVGAIGGISSSRCTNEEVYVVQKMVRAAFGNNNVDTCARVCHSPTGYGLKQTFGTSAGTQDFRSVDAGRRHPGDRRQPDRRPPGLRLADEAAAARGRPADRGRPAPDRPGPQPARRGGVPPPAAAGHQRRLRQRDGPRGRHRGPGRRGVRARALRGRRRLPRLHRRPGQLARGDGRGDRRRPRRAARGRPALRHRRQRRDLLRPRRHRALPGLDDGDGHGQPGHGHRQHRPRGRRRQPAARAEQRAGLLRHGLLPARVPRLPARLRRTTCAASTSELWGTTLDPEPGLRIPNMFDAALDGTFRGALHPGRGHRPVRPQHPARRGGPAGDGPRRRPGPVPQRDRQVRPRLPARHVVPGEGRHLHQRRAPDQPGPAGVRLEGRQGRVGDRLRDRPGDGLRHVATPPRREIMDEIAATTPTFAGVSFARLDEVGSMQWPVYDATSTGTPIMHVGEFVRGKGQLVETVVRADDRAERPGSSR